VLAAPAIIANIASMVQRRISVTLLAALAGAACTHAIPELPAPVPIRAVEISVIPCDSCARIPLGPEVARAVEKRIESLKARGGYCSSYAAVMEASYRSGQITLRPYMWRVGSQLASGEARANGEMILARDIDPLNVGVRTLDDVLWTLEHEAAHIAFRISNGVDAEQDRANEYVRTCRAHVEASR
jgi:hypothetical protein